MRMKIVNTYSKTAERNAVADGLSRPLPVAPDPAHTWDVALAVRPSPRRTPASGERASAALHAMNHNIMFHVHNIKKICGVACNTCQMLSRTDVKMCGYTCSPCVRISPIALWRLYTKGEAFQLQVRWRSIYFVVERLLAACFLLFHFLSIF